MISQQGFQFDSPNLQDSIYMAFSQMVMHMGHIGHNLHARLGHNLFQTIYSSLTQEIDRDFIVPDELVSMISQQGFYFDSPKLQDSFNMALSKMVLPIGNICPRLHAGLGHNECQMSSLTRQLNRDFILIYQTCRMALIWHYLGWYCKWATLVKIFMLVKGIMSVRWVCWHDKSTEILIWFTNLSG